MNELKYYEGSKEAQEVFESLAIENHDLSIDNIKINKKTDNDGIILSFRTNQLICVQRWFWKWAAEAWPINPKELVDDWLSKREKVNEIKLNANGRRS